MKQTHIVSRIGAGRQLPFETFQDTFYGYLVVVCQTGHKIVQRRCGMSSDPWMWVMHQKFQQRRNDEEVSGHLHIGREVLCQYADTMKCTIHHMGVWILQLLEDQPQCEESNTASVITIQNLAHVCLVAHTVMARAARC